MLVANFVTNNPNMGGTRTVEDFGKFLGTKTYKLGILAKLYQIGRASCRERV